MNITEITTLAGRHKRRRRVGRGCGSGMGKTCGRGQKGGGSRSGWKQRGLQEGGQMPTFRRIPKRGFSNARFAARYSVVNVEDLNERFQAGAHVTAVTLRVAGLLRNRGLPVKVLGDGELQKKLIVEAAKFSESARSKIEAAGGEARVCA